MEARPHTAGRQAVQQYADGRVPSRLRFCEIKELEKLKWKNK